MRFNLMAGAIGLVTAVTLIAGCTASDNTPTGKVKGRVTYKGQPLKEGTIVFHPSDGRSGVGQIRDGEIVNVTTYEPGDGAPFGPCNVSIQAMSNATDMYAPRKSLIPEKYASAEKSGLTADIIEGQETTVEFDLND